MALSEKDLARLKKTSLDLMGQDRQKLLVRFPFTGGILMRLELVPVRDLRLNTAATDGSRIFFDISFMSKLNADERLFVMAHEAWHCVLMHMLRCQTRNQKKFNVATDMEINRMLKKEGLVVPSWVLMPEPDWPDGLSAEEMYELLPANKINPQSGGSEGSKSGGKEGQFDKHVYPGDGEGEEKFKDQWGEKGIDPDFKVGFPKDLAEKIREKIVAVAQQMQRTRGDIPAHLESVVRAALKPQIRWQEVLAQFVTSCYGGSRRWLPPNRRHVGQGLYLQSSRKEMLRAVVAVDTSGSTTNDLPQFFSELNSLLNSFGDYELTVIQCDCEIQDVTKYDAFNPITSPEWKTYGHGGTDFRPPFEYVAEHPDIEPSCLIYITDGCGPAPERAPCFPVLWLLTADGSKPAPWGRKLRFKAASEHQDK